MNRYKALVLAIQHWLASPRLRYLPIVLAVCAAIGALALLVWLPEKEARVALREMGVEKELKAIQNDLGEIERLKMRKPPPEVPVSAVHEALTASLASVGPSLSVALVDSDHLRVQGTGRFDAIVRWLGDTQQGHRLSTTRMSVVRQKDEVAVDITMTSRRQ